MTWTRATGLTAALLAAVGSSAVVAALLGRTLTVTVAEPAGVALGVRLDLLSAVLLTFVAALCWLVARYSGRNLAGQRRTARFGALQLLTLLALAVLVTGASLPVVAVGWTVSGLTMAALIAHPDTPAARRAAAYVRRRLLLGDLALWSGVVLALILLPTVNRADLAVLDVDPLAATVVGLVLLVACVVRSALVPAQRWLPETAEAPSPVSALLHAGIVNGTAVLLTLFWPVVAVAPAVLGALVVLGAASVVVGTLTTRARADVKGRLACSTTAQMGYMTLQLGLGLPAAAVLHLIGHGCYKSWLFLRAGGTVSRLREERLTETSRAPQPAAVLGWALAACATAVVLSAPAVLDGARSLGPVVLVPLLLTLAAVAVAATTAARDELAPPRVVALLALAAGGGGAAYLWLLGAAEELLRDPLPKEPVWSPTVAGLLVVALLLTTAGLLVALRRLAHPVPGRLHVLLAGSALPPWSRRIGGTARWPSLVPPSGQTTHTTQTTDSTDTMTAPTTRSPLDQIGVVAAVTTAALSVGPVWPARSMVAANPMAGLEDLPVEVATAHAARLLGASGVLPLAEYARLVAIGRITPTDVAAAVRMLAQDAGTSPSAATVDEQVAQLMAGLAVADPDHPDRPRDSRDRATPASRAAQDTAENTVADTAKDTAEDHAALWTQRAWSRAVEDGPGPWQLWRAHAVAPGYDRAVGSRGLGALVQALPEDPAAALVLVLDLAGLDAVTAPAYLERVLTRSPGWTGHARWRARLGGTPAPLVELAALRVALDLLVTGSLAGTPGVGAQAAVPAADGSADARHVWQVAYELGYQQHLVRLLAPAARRLATAGADPGDGAVAGAIAGGTHRGEHGDRPVAHVPAQEHAHEPAQEHAQAQLVMCIDVRSERLRRHLEAAGPWQTFGFAGFFGLDLAYVSPTGATFEQCPALLRPQHTVRASPPVTDGRGALTRALDRAVGATGTAPLTPLLLAEAGGLLAGAAALARTVAPRTWARVVQAWTGSGGPWSVTGPLQLEADLAQRVDLAAGALLGMGLVDDFAPLLVLVGHTAQMQNNAFSTAYDCGACGGNGGQVNARVLAALLEDPDVRQGLADQGIRLPAGTVAVAALHCTTTDVVTLDPAAELPASHRALLGQLEHSLAVASARTRAERLPRLPGAPATTGGPADSAHLDARAEDWSQPCPEWGLAGNAALVVGPRELTRGTDLEGRVFLHSYDPRLDPDHQVLEVLLTAPLVVAQWISSQYYSSTVDPGILGAGDKTTHNVVGDVGVLTGAHGDLRLGLPWQSLFDGEPGLGAHRRRHEPLRLLALVWADPQAVLAVVRRHPGLVDLVAHGWVRLVAVDPSDGSPVRLDRRLTWVPWVPRVPLSEDVSVPVGAGGVPEPLG